MTTLAELKREAFEAAIDSLARYKPMMFGYHAAIWIYLNQIDPNKEPNPFRPLVKHARNIQAKYNGQSELLSVPKPSEAKG